MKTKLLLILITVAAFTGCALHRWMPTNDAQKEACRVAHYCGPDAGKILIGSDVCYTDHISQDVQVQDAAGKWHWNMPEDLKCK